MKLKPVDARNITITIECDNMFQATLLLAAREFLEHQDYYPTVALEQYTTLLDILTAYHDRIARQMEREGISPIYSTKWEPFIWKFLQGKSQSHDAR